LESAAAPTAGLHFTRELLEKLKQRGVETAFVTLAVGIGTFRPIQSETLDAHTMHEEEFEISSETARRIRQQKEQGRRVIAVGTTTVRVLESAARSGTIEEGSGRTDIFIRPGFEFKAVDALITNFHLPKSSLLVMITAFMQQKLMYKSEASSIAALEQVRYAYNEAVAQRYRFFSFGDAMFIE
jgi:S-adenosylmethionine:tRNA ribosyltransferase-isomerase